MEKKLPSSTKVVVIGGGVIGCSVAYHLAKFGWKDTILLERDQLTSGTTWHAAGLVSQLGPTAAVTKIRKYTLDLYKELEKKVDHSAGLRLNGALSIAENQGRWQELKRQATTAQLYNVDVQILDKGKINKNFPIINTKDVIGGIFMPGDGAADPVGVTNVLAKAAKLEGAQIFEKSPVEKILTKNGKIAGVRVNGQEDAGKILVGIFEGKSIPAFDKTNKVPEDFSFGEFQENFEHFEPYLNAAVKRFPILETAGIRKFFSGPESFTPDTNSLLGEVPEIKNFFVCCGLNSIGIGSGGGVGKATAEWMMTGHINEDIFNYDIKRFQKFHSQLNFIKNRITETLGDLYGMHWPFKQHTTSRNIGLFDLTPFSKFEIKAETAHEELQEICTADIKNEIGKCTYTHMLNSDGGIEIDLTVVCLDKDYFRIISSAATRERDKFHIKKHLSDDIELKDVTEDYCVLGLFGPKSRNLISNISNDDFSNEKFKFATAKHINIEGINVWIQRLSYVGELGFELYVKTNNAKKIFELLLDKGKKYNISNCGMHAMDTMRMESGFLHWGHDISPEENQYQAGLNFTISYKKNTNFIGKQALEKIKNKKITKRLVMFVLKDSKPGNPLLLHDEPIYLEDKIIGRTTSGNYSFNYSKNLSFGYIDTNLSNEELQNKNLFIEVEKQKYPANIELKPLKNKTVRLS
jgi:glycine cleavage system T protein